MQPLMQPREIALLQPTANSAEIVLHLDACLFWFGGHFPQQPILPGVAQLDWVMGYARRLLVGDYQFHSIRQLKFQSPLLPDQRVSLMLEWQASRQLLLFSYYRHKPERIPHEPTQQPVEEQPSVKEQQPVKKEQSPVKEQQHTASDTRYALTSNGKIHLCR